jgi:hypothetical protein
VGVRRAEVSGEKAQDTCILNLMCKNCLRRIVRLALNWPLLKLPNVITALSFGTRENNWLRLAQPPLFQTEIRTAISPILNKLAC